MKPLGKVKLNGRLILRMQSGFLTTDGNLSPDGRHISFTSKDRKLVSLLKKCLNLSNKITKKGRGGECISVIILSSLETFYFMDFYYHLVFLPQNQKPSVPLIIPDEHFFLIFACVISMVMVRFTRIGIRGGNQAICFIPYLSLQARIMYTGYGACFSAFRDTGAYK